MGRESLLTHTHGAEVTAGATLLGKNRASYQKITWKLWVKLRKRELVTDKDSSSSCLSVIISVAVKGVSPASLTLHLSPWIYYLFLFPTHLRGCVFPSLTSQYLICRVVTGPKQAGLSPKQCCGGMRDCQPWRSRVRSPCTPSSSLGSLGKVLSQLPRSQIVFFICIYFEWGVWEPS